MTEWAIIRTGSQHDDRQTKIMEITHGALLGLPFAALVSISRMCGMGFIDNPIGVGFTNNSYRRYMDEAFNLGFMSRFQHILSTTRIGCRKGLLVTPKA